MWSPGDRRGPLSFGPDVKSSNPPAETTATTICVAVMALSRSMVPFTNATPAPSEVIDGLETEMTP